MARLGICCGNGSFADNFYFSVSAPETAGTASAQEKSKRLLESWKTK